MSGSSNMVLKGSKKIFCDLCPEEDRKPAQKTCMKCEISMCVQHLQAHLTTPVLLQTHPLTEPISYDGDSKCPLHGKLLEYYCLDDVTCVCVSCAIEDQHRLHNMKTFPTAHKELMEKLTAQQQVLKENNDDKAELLERWEKKEMGQLSRCSVRLIEAVTGLRDISLTSVQSSVSARMASIKTSKNSIQAAQKEKDTFKFLQMYSQVHKNVEKAKAVDLRKGLEPGLDRDKLVQEIRQNGEKMLNQASQFVGLLLTLVDPENHRELLAVRSDLFFKPHFLEHSMFLSQDNRKVFHNSLLGECSTTLQICSDKTEVKSWMVRFPKTSDWMIGICDNFYQKANFIFALHCENDSLCSVSTTEYNRKCYRNKSLPIRYLNNDGKESSARPEKVEVFWDVNSATLSFFNRIGKYQRQEIITLHTSLKHGLTPFVCFGEIKVSSYHQKEWKCACGLFYNKTAYGYSRGNNQFSFMEKCRCEKDFGGSCNTEMVCELLTSGV